MARTFLLTVLFLVGCGPIRATVGLVDAQRAVREAQDAGASEHAIYPLTLAEQLLAKAIEEKGYAEWEQSFLLAEQAVRHANEATELCKARVEAPLWPGAAAPPEATPEPGEPSYYDLPSDDDDSPADPGAGDDDDSAADAPEEDAEDPNPWTMDP